MGSVEASMVTASAISETCASEMAALFSSTTRPVRKVSARSGITRKDKIPKHRRTRITRHLRKRSLYLYPLSCVGQYTTRTSTLDPESGWATVASHRRAHSRLRSRRFRKTFSCGYSLHHIGSQGGTPARQLTLTLCFCIINENKKRIWPLDPPSSRHLVAVSREMLIDVLIDRSIRHQPRSVLGSKPQHKVVSSRRPGREDGGRVFQWGHTINGEGTFRFLHKHLNWPPGAG